MHLLKIAFLPIIFVVESLNRISKSNIEGRKDFAHLFSFQHLNQGSFKICSMVHLVFGLGSKILHSRLAHFSDTSFSTGLMSTWKLPLCVSASPKQCCLAMSRYSMSPSVHISNCVGSTIPSRKNSGG